MKITSTLFTLSLGLVASLYTTQTFAQDYGQEQARPAQNEGWQYTVGTGVMLSPSYLGDDAYQVSALPNVQVKYNDTFFASVQEGAGYNVINTENWRAGPIVRYQFSRDEDGEAPFQISGDDTRDLRGLGDVDGTIEIGGYIEYKINPLSAKLELRQGLGGHEGMIGSLSGAYKTQTHFLNYPMFVSVGPEIAFADEDYHQAYFNVNAVQSAASGLPRYDADSGVLTYTVNGTAVAPITENVSAVFIARYGRLGEESGDSSLVRERGSKNQGTLGAFVNYSF